MPFQSPRLRVIPNHPFSHLLPKPQISWWKVNITVHEVKITRIGSHSEHRAMLILFLPGIIRIKPQYLSDILKHFQLQSQKKINEPNQTSKHFSKYNICSLSIILSMLVTPSLGASTLCLLRWSWRAKWLNERNVSTGAGRSLARLRLDRSRCK